LTPGAGVNSIHAEGRAISSRSALGFFVAAVQGGWQGRAMKRMSIQIPHKRRLGVLVWQRNRDASDFLSIDI